MPGIHDAIIFTTTLPDGRNESYSFTEVLAVRAAWAIDTPDSEMTRLIEWLQSDNLNRLAYYISVAQLRAGNLTK